VLVIQDLLGMNREFRPKFVKRYASLHETIKAAVDAYAKEVRGGAFPADEHCFKN
jgi:3-methyl-2-oxobutanoate hydroxymethyltransferase